jgi:hypothetical protein
MDSIILIFSPMALYSVVLPTKITIFGQKEVRLLESFTKTGTKTNESVKKINLILISHIYKLLALK